MRWEPGSLPASFGLDLGVVNEAHTNSGFLPPGRYSSETINADAPLEYFTDPLRSVLYGCVNGVGAERDGKIDYDGTGPDGRSKQLAFVFDNYDPSQARISVGGQLARVGTFEIGASDPPFASISPVTGITTCHLAIVDRSAGRELRRACCWCRCRRRM